MKDLGNFILNEWETNPDSSLIKEYRTAGSKNAAKANVDDGTPNFPKLKNAPEQGQDEEENESGGTYSIDSPSADDLATPIDFGELTRNQRKVLARLEANQPFFVQGQAGWGKTSIIVAIAKKCNMHVVTVYLDKCEATDLGGLPTPAKSKRGADYVKHLMPHWAKVIYDNPDEKFLLFFDEMNQAQPDVMNALMPIVKETKICGIKFKNFLVAAAGNEEEENQGGLSELSAPLRSRFGGVIKWQSGDWDSAMKHLAKKWKDKISDTFMKAVADNAPEVFYNPRDVETFVIEKVVNLKTATHGKNFKADDYEDDLKDTAKPADELQRSGEAKLTKLAEAMYKFVNDKEDADTNTNSRKNREMVPENILKLLKQGIVNGYIKQDGRKYGVSEENIFKIEDWDFPREMLERSVNKILADGAKFKFKKDSEWQKAGYEDPNAD